MAFANGGMGVATSGARLRHNWFRDSDLRRPLRRRLSRQKRSPILNGRRRLGKLSGLAPRPTHAHRLLHREGVLRPGLHDLPEEDPAEVVPVRPPRLEGQRFDVAVDPLGFGATGSPTATPRPNGGSPSTAAKQQVPPAVCDFVHARAMSNTRRAARLATVPVRRVALPARVLLTSRAVGAGRPPHSDGDLLGPQPGGPKGAPP